MRCNFSFVFVFYNKYNVVQTFPHLFNSKKCTSYMLKSDHYPIAEAITSLTFGSVLLTAMFIVTPSVSEVRANFALINTVWPPRYTPDRNKTWVNLFSGTLSERSHGCIPKKCTMFLTASKIKIQKSNQTNRKRNQGRN